VAGFSGGFTQDPVLINLARVVAGNSIAPDPAAGGLVAGLYDIAIPQGSVAGALGLANASEWTNTSEFGTFAQCTDAEGGSLSCGFADNTSFVVHPPLAVPAPATVLLLGSGLLGAGLASRFRRK